MRIDKAKKYRTLYGNAVRIYEVEGSGPFPVHGAIRSTSGFWMVTGWTEHGKNKVDSESDWNDLIEETEVLEEAKTKSKKDLDRVVAKAIGMTIVNCIIGSDRDLWVDPRIPDVPAKEFHPSFDLNDAFYAAEAAGVFECVNRFLRKDVGDGEWEIVDMIDGIDINLVSSDTPALAICDFILKYVELQK